MDDLSVSGLRIDWNMLTDSYVSRIPSLRSIDELEFHKNVTFLVGENGSGKSTLLEGIAVACGFNAEGGTRNYRFSTYDDTSDLAKAMTIYRQYAIGPSSFFLRARTKVLFPECAPPTTSIIGAFPPPPAWQASRARPIAETIRPNPPSPRRSGTGQHGDTTRAPKAPPPP